MIPDPMQWSGFTQYPTSDAPVLVAYEDCGAAVRFCVACYRAGQWWDPDAYVDPCDPGNYHPMLPPENVLDWAPITVPVVTDET